MGERRAGIYPMRLTDEIITAVDAYVEREGLKTRSEAFRRLVETGLESVAKQARRKDKLR
jgi:metal-responsive CopG/Arc/MetJ family transcriptional regulator